MMNQSYLARSAIIRYRMSIPTDPIPNDPIPTDPPPHLF